jgi:hypothetical protein
VCACVCECGKSACQNVRRCARACVRCVRCVRCVTATVACLPLPFHHTEPHSQPSPDQQTSSFQASHQCTLLRQSASQRMPNAQQRPLYVDGNTDGQTRHCTARHSLGMHTPHFKRIRRTHNRLSLANSFWEHCIPWHAPVSTHEHVRNLFRRWPAQQAVQCSRLTKDASVA